MIKRPEYRGWSGDVAAMADYIVLAANALEITKRKLYADQSTVCSDAVTCLQADILMAIRKRVSKEAK